MAGKKVDPEIAAESSWSLGDSEGLNDGCFFGGDYKVSGGLHEFAWSFPEESAVGGGGDGGFDGLDRIESGFAGGGADDYTYAAASSTPRSTESTVLAEEEKMVSASASASNPSVSSSSCEDRPEKSTASGGTSSNPPPDSAIKTKKKGQKRIRQQRFAFMTKSEVDHLEDGYRWRKYGQKAVKNSPFPRSYYRCTNSKCTVKKRVERSCKDPTVVITTYEGQHCHHSVGFPRGRIIPQDATFTRPLATSTSQFYYPRLQFLQENSIQFTQSPSTQGHVEQSHIVRGTSSKPPTDEGLIGDIVPPGMRKGQL
ncbi:probable WRKY transcription factor 57 [Primulina eburnea]|uniref:probable WRKY transcription factor 57 n=1 Tax=Primulina eburnea TaxID=1245227 RepID=UPI003C6C6E83